MRPYGTAILLLATLAISVRSLPLDIENAPDNSALSISESDESVQEKSNEQDSSIPEEDSSISKSDSSIDSSAPVDENSEETLEKSVVKRSPEIPDPDRYQPNDRDDRPEAPSVHPTHDEYLEWKLRQPRFRRNLEDDSLNDDYREVQAFAENSLEDYAQGCEVMEENSDENNETTYNDYRRKRRANEEPELGESAADSDVEDEPEPESEPESVDAVETEGSEDAQADEKAEESEELRTSDELSEVKPSQVTDTGAADLEEPAASNENDDSSAVVVSEESEKP